MGQTTKRTILFLCTGNYYRSRFAEIYFNSIADKFGLPWRATSRGLALERGVNNVGPMAVSAIKALELLGVRNNRECSRLPLPAASGDFEQASLVIALKQTEHQPLLVERFPSWAEKVEFWHIDDAADALSCIERAVMGLVARLCGGKDTVVEEAPVAEVCLRCQQPLPNCTCKAANVVARVGRETKGRRGKGVTTVSDLPFAEVELLELAAKLKQKCGTGGTVKDGRIEIQGDQRERIVKELERLGFRVKRVGG